MQTQILPDSGPRPAIFPDYGRNYSPVSSFEEPFFFSPTSQQTCQQVLDEGGCTVDEFCDELIRMVKQHFHEKRNSSMSVRDMAHSKLLYDVVY
jgi:hypothetical protein